VSNTGSAAVMPEGAYWAVSDETIGSITADGVFTSGLEAGTVDVQIKTADGTVVGKKTINVVAPDKLVFTKDILNAIYGEPTKLPLEASYKGNLVLFKSSDIIAAGNVIGAITSEGDVITALESSGVRALRITAALASDDAVNAVIKANFYKPGESSFDFDNVTYGDREFAWLRELSNSETFDGSTFYTVDTSEGHTLKYTFAIDMTEIQIPEKLNDIIYMLPGADTGATAWDFLLQLAERVSVLSEVRITAQFDPDLEIDISELTVVNEYFYLRDAQLDDNNKLTIICGWVDQTASINPATANPMCILNGIVGTPKADAGDTVAIVNSGNISYNIFLRASSLYSFACSPTNQEKFGLIPFDNPDVIINGGTEKGASFGSVYATFNDNISLVRTDRNGWYNFDSQLYYYVDNKPIAAGIHLLPSFEDPSVKLYYEFTDNGALVSSHTGFIGSGDNLKYALLGVPQTGWITVNEADGSEAFYYFSPTTYNAVNGEQIVDNGFKALFVDYKCVRGELIENANGLRYRFGGAWQRNQWIEYEGKYYYFHNNYYALNANSEEHKFWIRNIKGDDAQEYHIFDENCVWRNDMTGIYYDDGGLCFIRNGVRVAEAGIVYLGGNYYYFMSNTRPVISGSYWPTEKLANGLVPGNKQYFFDEYGRMTNVPATAAGVPDGNEGKNGVYTEADGTLGYYIHGAKRFNMGLVELTDDVYIYVDRYGALAVGECEVTKTNGLLTAGTYTFDENGRYTPAPDIPDEPDEPDVPVDPDNKNGIIEENGVLYYYIDGVLAEGAGLVEVEEGVLIYVRADGRLALGLYWPTVTNDLLPLGKYDFGDNGKYTIIGNEWGEEDDGGDVDTPTEPEVPDTTPKNGIVEEDGVYYYYIDGVKAYCYGLLEIEDGVYIYVRSNGQLATGSYWPTNMIEAYLPKGLYDFGEDGRYIAEDSESDTLKNGIVEEDGVLRYYVDGRVAYGAGLIEIEKNVYIYVRSNGVLATGKYWPTNSNGLLSPGVYNFGTDGKYVKG
ncbi:MAG: hypothetical protein IJF13_00455, partial [Clostridia bacterium]|nr:hypothetical protein [Clostridia bacterium]